MKFALVSLSVGGAPRAVGKVVNDAYDEDAIGEGGWVSVVVLHHRSEPEGRPHVERAIFFVFFFVSAAIESIDLGFCFC